MTAQQRYDRALPPDTLRLVLDDDYIDDGKGGEPRHCAVALLVGDLFHLPAGEVSVTHHGIEIGQCWYYHQPIVRYQMNPQLEDWLIHFDQWRREMEAGRAAARPVPTTFTVEMWQP